MGRSKKSHQKGVHYLAQQEGVESAEKVYPTIPRKFERLRDVIFHSIWGSFAIGLVLLGSVPSPGPNNRPMQTLILLLGLDTQQQGTKEKHVVVKKQEGNHAIVSHFKLNCVLS